MTLVGFGLACLSCIALSLSLKRHFRQALPGNGYFDHWRPRGRILGYAFVALALAPCVIESGPWIGLVLWISMLAAAAFLQTLLLTYWPSRIPVFISLCVALIFTGMAS